MPLITMPKLSDTMTEGTIACWRKNKGDSVEMGDVIAEVETDKATMEMEAFDEGVLTEIYVEAGGVAAVGAKIALVLGEDESAEEPEGSAMSDLTTAEPEAKAASKEPVPPAAAAPVFTSGRVKASPYAKKIATERGVSLEGVAGTGPGGRIIARDVPAPGTPAAPVLAAAASVAPSIPPQAAGAEDETVALSGMRKVIAERLLASKTQIPHFYLSREIDAGALMRVRKELNSANEAADLPKLTINDFILLAVSRAAAAHPDVNAAWAGNSIIRYAGVHLAVAVAVDDGLVTPVIRDAQKLSLKEISASVKDLAARARTKKLKPEEYQGGTITISNLGAYGVDQFYAIVNPPQAAILAIGAIVLKPVVNDKGEIVAGHRLTIALSGDHRVVDGAVGALFVGELKRLIENPALMLF